MASARGASKVVDFPNPQAILQEATKRDRLLDALQGVEEAPETRRVEIARRFGIFSLLRKADPLQRAQVEKRLAKVLGVPLRDIRREVAQAVPEEETSEEYDLETGRAFAKELGEDLLNEVVKAVHALGVVGEERLIKLIYLVLTSRLLSRPVSLAIQNTTSTGKNWVLEKVVRLFPLSAVIQRTGLSEHALAYSEEDFCHRTLIIYELGGVDTEQGNYLLRSLLSEGHIEYETVEKTERGLRSRLIKKEGPTNVIFTTTKVKLHPENETRLVSAWTDDSREQTARVLRRSAEESAEVDVTPWRAFQAWLESQPREVVIPYALRLAELIPPINTRLRRDFNNLLSLIKAHALLHQERRERDPEGRVVANLEDYEVVRDLYEPLLAVTLGVTVKETVRETVAAVREILQTEEYATLRALEEKLGLGQNAVARRVRECLSRGYLIDVADRRQGRERHIVLGDPLPGEGGILPEPEKLVFTPQKTIGKLVNPSSERLFGFANRWYTVGTKGENPEPGDQLYQRLPSNYQCELGHLPGIYQSTNDSGGVKKEFFVDPQLQLEGLEEEDTRLPDGTIVIGDSKLLEGKPCNEELL